MITIEPGFHPAQQRIATSTARFRIVKAGRRGGKTRLGVSEEYKRAVEGKQGLWVSPTYSMGLVAWKPALLIAKQIPGSKVSIVEKEIGLPGGGNLLFRSSDNPDSMRGLGMDFVVIDEAAYIRNLKELWELVIRPALTDRRGEALIMSTPKGIGSDFYNMYLAAEGGAADWEAFSFPTSDNPFIDPKEIEDARNGLGGLVFAQEYLGEFVELGGTMFRTEWERICQRVIKDGSEWFKWTNPETGDTRMVDGRAGFRYATVDLAVSTKQSADYTVIASCLMSQGVLIVLEVVRRRMEGPDILPAVRKEMASHNLPVVHMESAGFQLSLVQQARREGLAVKELKADKDKPSRALTLQARMEAGDVWFCEGPWLRELELELFGFPASEHDDQVDALAYAAIVAGEQGRKRPGLEGLAGFGSRTSPNKPG